jgi:integrase
LILLDNPRFSGKLKVHCATARLMEFDADGSTGVAPEEPFVQDAKAKASRIRFTKDALNRIKPPASGRIYTYDESTRGLTLCTTAAGTQSFYLYRKVAGKPERIRLGGWPELTIEQARRAAASHNGKIAEGQNPVIAIRAKRQAPTLSKVFDLFVVLPTRTKAKRPKSPVTLRNYRQIWRTYLADWQERKLSGISKGDIEKLHNRLGVEVGHHAANRTLELIRALFNCAIDHFDFATNPAARLTPFEEVSRERFLQADEVPRFWEALDKEPSEKVRDFIKLLLFVGQRRMNTLQMRWEDVNLKAKVWAIPQTKTGRHTVPLTKDALAILNRRHKGRGDSEYVFPGLHGRGHLQDPMRQWREMLKRAGIENLRLHDLRRSMGSWQAATGASLPIIGKTLGHARAETTQKAYAHVVLSPVRDAMETATAAIMAAAKPKKSKGRGAK